jgi:Uma2 family endonuclease
MAAAPQVSEYEPEIVRGEVVERPMPDKIHGLLTTLLVLEFAAAISARALWVAVGMRVKTSAGNLRLPDLAVYAEEPPARVPEKAPLATIEILSPDERYFDVIEKCREYRTWGVENIWTVEAPELSFGIYRDGALQPARELRLPVYGVHIKAESLFAQLPK